MQKLPKNTTGKKLLRHIIRFMKRYIKNIKKIKGSQVLIFGGLGFIGRNLAASLLALGAKVKIVDIDPSDRNLKVIKKIDNIEIVRGDVLDKK